MQIESIAENLKFEKEKYEVIRDKSREQYRSHDETTLFYDEHCAPELSKIFKSILCDESRTNALLADGKNMNTDESTTRIRGIRDLLKNGRLDKVAQYIINLDGKVGHENMWKTMRVEEQVMYFVTLLKTYLFDDFVS